MMEFAICINKTENCFLLSFVFRSHYFGARHDYGGSQWVTAFTVKIMANLRLKVNIFPLLSPETFFLLLTFVTTNG